MHLIIKTIPHEQQRYDTYGDYRQVFADKWLFTISDIGDPDEEFCILIHELVEWYLTQRHGISEEEITAWDTEFLRIHPETEEEPGNDLLAPYHAEHQIAERIERAVAEALSRDRGIDDAISTVSVTGQ